MFVTVLSTRGVRNLGDRDDRVREVAREDVLVDRVRHRWERACPPCYIRVRAILRVCYIRVAPLYVFLMSEVPLYTDCRSRAAPLGTRLQTAVCRVRAGGFRAQGTNRLRSSCMGRGLPP